MKLIPAIIALAILVTSALAQPAPNQPSGRATLYVSNSGDDANDGTTPCTPARTISHLIQLHPDNADILLHRGENFVTTAPITIAGSVSLAAYGTGQRPVITGSPSQDFSIVLATSAHDLEISGLVFDSPSPANLNKDGAASAIQAAGRNITVRDCIAANVCDFVNANGNPNGLTIIGCRDAGPTSVRGYFCWVQGANVAIINNVVTNSTREHCIRVGGCTNLAIVGNDLQNLDRTATDSQDISKATINMQIGRNVLVAGNTSRNGGFGVGPLGGADGVAHPESKSENVIVADNTMLDSNLQITSGVDYVLERGNTSHRPSSFCFNIQPNDPASPVYAVRKMNHVTIDSNTFTLDGADGQFAIISNPPLTGAITITNNTMIAPKFTTGANQDAAMFVLAPDLSGFASIAGNRWPIPVRTTWIGGAAMYVWPAWSDPRGYLTPAQWNALPQVSGRDTFGN